jgi:SAM-dependent methyltransferase
MIESKYPWESWAAERKRTGIMGETSKAKSRRLRENWFEKYAPEQKSGIDIGCSDDPLNHTFRRWDIQFGDGDATFMEGVPNGVFHSVYASHVLEHLIHPAKAIERWYDILSPGGHLTIVVPHRDLYEKRRVLPSNWNHDHKYFWLPEEEDLPCTKSLRKEILKRIPNANIVSFRVIDDGYNYSLGKEEHPIGEYSIEAIIQKPF